MIPPQNHRIATLTFIVTILLIQTAIYPARAAAPAIVTEEAETARVIDGDTLVIANGQRVRLDGIDALEIPHRAEDMPRCLPSLRRPDADHAASCDLALAGAARDMLISLTLGKKLRLEINPARRHDRYGRILAEIFADGADVNRAIVAAGLAYVYPLSGKEIKIPELGAAEREARAAHRGIWQLPEMQPLPPERAQEAYGRYAFVTGKVLKAARVRDKTYLNFGDNYRTDFTATIEKRDLKNFRDLDPLTLQGKTITIRGFPYEDNGPMIRLTNQGQIEINP